MTLHEPVRIVHLRERPSRIATVRDLAIILVCAAILLGTLADLLLRTREPRVPQAGATTAPAVSLSL